MEQLDELKEQLGRYKRLSESEDFQKTMEDAMDMFAPNKSPMNICNLPNANEYLWCREGVRLLINWFDSLVERTESAVKLAEETQQKEETYVNK